MYPSMKHSLHASMADLCEGAEGAEKYHKLNRAHLSPLSPSSCDGHARHAVGVVPAALAQLLSRCMQETSTLTWHVQGHHKLLPRAHLPPLSPSSKKDMRAIVSASSPQLSRSCLSR